MYIKYLPRYKVHVIFLGKNYGDHLDMYVLSYNACLFFIGFLLLCCCMLFFFLAWIALTHDQSYFAARTVLGFLSLPVALISTIKRSIGACRSSLPRRQRHAVCRLSPHPLPCASP